MHRTMLAALSSAILTFPPGVHAQQATTPYTPHPVVDEAGTPLGSVALAASSCEPDAAERVKRGLALMHNMTYGEAREAFLAAVDQDDGCVLGYWGGAMTLIHPLWPDVPSEEAFRQGRALLTRAREARPGAQEEAYLGPVEAYFHEGEARTERERLASFADGWQDSRRRFPDDPEIELFDALARLATALGTPDMVERNARAGAAAEAVLERIPDHPGALHYTIHAYDLPALATRAEAAARVYGEVAPENSHALHMTSHIFTRLGLWEESIHYNERAGTAALANPIGHQVSFHYLHAVDYLVYAMLQRGDDRGAAAILADLDALEGPIADHAATAYAFAAVAARLVLERRKWAEASRLSSRPSTLVPWDAYPHLEAIPTFARGLGAARSGDLVRAEAALARLTELEAGAAALEQSYDWAEQVRIQSLALRSWIAYAKGDVAEALRAGREAQALESATVKNPVTPGEVLPAAELLGDLLVEVGRHDEARAAYRAALARSPNRLLSLSGLGQAAEAMGDEDEARWAYERIDAMAVADSSLPCVQRARAFLAR